ncbi:sensor histidine kinase [Peteryoungia ipomoeae]|uniref:histidine kinase n=1 Tax=Peteryoungia ipomoeae TaxID=1210932 RepID=A0A4S8P1H3_9HYPH|nr:HAMP domain-containing histidine kinase [Peteryoungia ipomoeae]
MLERQDSDSPSGLSDGYAMPPRIRGLSGRLLWLTIALVMIVEAMIFAPSIATMRLRWLEDRLNTAAAAATVIDGLQPVELPRKVQDDTLASTGTRAIVLRKDGTSRLLAVAKIPAEVDAAFDLANYSSMMSVQDAFYTLFFGGDRMLRVFGPVGDSDMIIEVVMQEQPLRKAMLTYSRNILVISLAISIITGLLLFLVINRIMVVPVRRLARSMQAFAENPEDPAGILAVGKGRDEVAVAGRHLARMQDQLQKTLRQQKTLVELGLAVSKINHDMRNILASAQLMSDRLVDVDDPMVKSFAPKLLRTIDRAVGYTNEVLSYGQTSEAEPRRRRFALVDVCREVRDLLHLSPDSRIEFIDQTTPDIEIDADSEQIFRVVHNLCRNAVQALMSFTPEDPDHQRRITLSAQRTGSVVSITIDDTGPGMPRKAKENLFMAFRGSARSGGTGLGLAIARELVLAHGGTIALVEKPGPGTMFRIEIPDRPVDLDVFRARA